MPCTEMCEVLVVKGIIATLFKLYNMLTLRKFYQKTYPTDELGQHINLTTFVALIDCLHRGGDVYQYIGVHDSLVRERLFEELAKMLGSNYDYIYDLWMQGIYTTNN
jgi:hypothetical protein